MKPWTSFQQEPVFPDLVCLSTIPSLPPLSPLPTSIPIRPLLLPRIPSLASLTSGLSQVPGYDRVHVLRRTFYTVNLMGKLRDVESTRAQFVDAARKISVMLLNEALGMLPYTPKTITTPVDGAKYVTFEMPDPEK